MRHPFLNKRFEWSAQRWQDVGRPLAQAHAAKHNRDFVATTVKKIDARLEALYLRGVSKGTASR